MGKLRDTITVPKAVQRDELQARALAGHDNIVRTLDGAEPKSDCRSGSIGEPRPIASWIAALVLAAALLLRPAGCARSTAVAAHRARLPNPRAGIRGNPIEGKAGWLVRTALRIVCPMAPVRLKLQIQLDDAIQGFGVRAIVGHARTPHAARALSSWSIRRPVRRFWTRQFRCGIDVVSSEWPPSPRKTARWKTCRRPSPIRSWRDFRPSAAKEGRRSDPWISADEGEQEQIERALDARPPLICIFVLHGPDGRAAALAG